MRYGFGNRRTSVFGIPEVEKKKRKGQNQNNRDPTCQSSSYQNLSVEARVAAEVDGEFARPTSINHVAVPGGCGSPGLCDQRR